MPEGAYFDLPTERFTEGRERRSLQLFREWDERPARQGPPGHQGRSLSLRGLIKEFAGGEKARLLR